MGDEGISQLTSDNNGDFHPQTVTNYQLPETCYVANICQ